MTEEGTGPPVFDAAAVDAIRRGVDEFNAGRFFECHDTLEDVWQGTRGEARDFLQGLIQISVAFYHLRNGNRTGGASQIRRALENLEAYGERYAGMELARLREEVRGWLDRVRSGGNLEASVADLPKFDYRPP